MNFGLPKKDLEVILTQIKSNLGNTKNPKLYIYGSRVKGNYRDFSDIDILLKADEFDKEALARINFFDLDTPYKVDFVLDCDLFEGYRDEIYGHMVSL